MSPTGDMYTAKNTLHHDAAIFVGDGLDLRCTWDKGSNDSRLLHRDEI